MPERQDRSELIKEFFSLSLEKREIAFIHLGYAGIILRVEDRAVAIDIANLLANEELDAFSELDLNLAFGSIYIAQAELPNIGRANQRCFA